MAFGISQRTPFERGWAAFTHSFEIRTRDFREFPTRWVGEQMNQLAGSFFAAGVLTTLNPFGGVIFGVVELVTRMLVSRQYGPINPEDSALRRITKIAMPLMVGIGVGCAAVALAGYSLTAGMVVSLAVGTVAYTALLTLTLFTLGTIYYGAHAVVDGVHAFCNG